jgi:hypothetical protein
MFVHFWISVDDFSWLSCFVVYNLGYLSLSDLMMKSFAIIAFLIFRLVSNDGHFKSFSNSDVEASKNSLTSYLTE